MRLSCHAASHKAFEHFALVVDGPPQVMLLAVDLHENLVQVPPQWLDRIPETRRFRISAANIGPNLFHQNLTVSWLMSMPRSCRRSSPVRSGSGNRMYIITASRMISGEVLK